MDMVVKEDQAIFASAGQAVHVAFLILSQPATQDAPLRKALIRVMESVNLNGSQSNWLNQLRGEQSCSVNFAGLSSSDIRAQCAMITQAVSTNLPNLERWVLQAKFGQTDFEDIEVGDQQLPPTRTPRVRRRFAFSAERIAAIHGLSEYFAPMFPRMNPMAIDCMLGRMFANHKKIEISSRDLAANFGGNQMTYVRASWKLKNQVRAIEEMAMRRLEPVFISHGLIPSDCNELLCQPPGRWQTV